MESDQNRHVWSESKSRWHTLLILIIDIQYDFFHFGSQMKDEKTKQGEERREKCNLLILFGALWSTFNLIQIDNHRQMNRA